MPKPKEHEVVVNTEPSIWVTVCCSECGEDLACELHSDKNAGLTVEVEPHTCKEKGDD